MSEKIKVSEHSDDELCLVISKLIESYPLLPSQESLSDEIPEKAWKWMPFGNCWQPINWLAPENWTHLLEEFYENQFVISISNVSKDIVDANFSHGCYENDAWTAEVSRHWGSKIITVKADTKERAVCEAYAIAFGGGKYE